MKKLVKKLINYMLNSSDFGHSIVVAFGIVMAAGFTILATIAIHDPVVAFEDSVSQYAPQAHKQKKIPAHDAPTPDRGMPVALNK